MVNRKQNIIKPKEIVFKIDEFPHVSETFIVAQIVTAIKLDYDVQIIAKKVLGVENSLRSSLVDKYDLRNKIVLEDYKIPQNKFVRFFKWICVLALNIKHIKNILNFYKEQPKFSFTWLFQWIFFKQFNNASLVHIQYGTNSKPLDTIKKAGGFKPPIIVTFHGHDAFFPINGYIPNNGYYNNLFEVADLITANTSYLANKILELGCPKNLLFTVPVSVDTNFFYPPTNKKKLKGPLKLITVGRLNKVKGHKYCIEVVRQLNNLGLDVTLTIIGEGPERKFLENLIIDYGIEDKVFLIGKESPIGVRELLWQHDVYLLTAVPLPDSRRETQGLATLEAQACGLPAVVFDSGGVKYTVKDKYSGFVCKEYDVKTVIEKIVTLIKHPNLINKMGHNAVIFVKNEFSQEVINERWKLIYEKIINNAK